MKKKLISVICVCSLLFAMMALSVGAAESMLITGVQIDAVVNTDGTVSVTETWTVEPAADDRGFERQIDLYDGSGLNEMTLLQKFDEVKDVKVKIDGVAAEESPSGNNTYTAKQAADARSFDIDISSPTVNTEKVYTIEYTLVGAVKQNAGKAVFSYRVIGKTFRLTSNNVVVNVVLPSGIDLSDVLTDGEIKDENTVSFHSKRVYDVFQISLEMDDSVFDKGALASYSSFAESMVSFGSAVRSVLPVILFVIFAIVIILVVLLRDRLCRRKVERGVARIMTKDSLDNIDSVPNDKTPCETYKMLMPYSRVSPKSTSKIVPLLFALSMLECIENGYIAADGEALIVGTPKTEVPSYIASTLNFLKEFCAKKEDRYVIDASFADKIRNECMTHYDLIANYLATFYNLIPAVDGKFFKNERNREFYEKAYAVKLKCEKLKSKLTFEDCIGNVLEGEKVSDEKIFAMMFSSLSNEKIFAVKTTSAAGYLARAFGAVYSVYVKSK